MPDGVELYGIRTPEGRTPTFCFNIEGRRPREVAELLAERDLYVWDGDYYALEPMRALGLADSGGAVRAGFLHYTTEDEVDRLLEAPDRTWRRRTRKEGEETPRAGPRRPDGVLHWTFRCRTTPSTPTTSPRTPAPRGAPHLRQRGMRTEPCRYGQCDGSGWIEVEETNGARECSCRRERVAAARAARLATSIPRRYLDVDFDRWPITNLDQKIVSFVRKYCRRLEKNIDDGAGLYFYGEVGSGKTSLAMVVAKEVLRERRSLAIFSGPDLLAKIVSTYEDRSPRHLPRAHGAARKRRLPDPRGPRRGEAERLAAGAALRRDQQALQDRRPLLVTADVGAPELLGEHIGHRTGSRILEMCEAIPFLDGDHRVKATTPEDVRLAS